MTRVVAHRGFKREYPENTLLAFTQARNAGATIIELDLQMTVDNQIVVCHDFNTGRVYNKDLNIHKSTLEELKHLITIRSPHEKMPTLENVLNWIQLPDNDGVKLMFDIKRVNDLKILKLLQDQLLKTPINRNINDDDNQDLSNKEIFKFWQTKLIIGIWNFEQYDYILENNLFFGFDKCIISFALELVLPLLKVSDAQKDVENRLSVISLLHVITWENLAYKVEEIKLDEKQLQESFESKKITALQYFLGKYVLPKKVQLFFWTVNNYNDMDWVLNLPFVEGIISDNPDVLHDKLTINRPPEPTEPQERLKYLKNSLIKLQKSKPWFFSKTGLRRASLTLLFRLVKMMLFFKLQNVGLFGFTIGKALFSFNKAVGLV